ncbi:DUF397 domain-containing protein [Streptomyces sp. NBS 14/10]|uniref:DUF397 domain-containing protein n=1 Tax=Streptomyces sp. NBS 14/10 TaxID=1945643 RepID=UPI000B7F76E4|nr:DUF397 domain-containing protein [Streptomyces sp. NBS 14/10]KAK1180013.1 DUF397 domain-containing protein [Streptomyces sp. NBS 14/10]
MTLKPFEWIKSSYSTDDGPSCVEVAATPDTIHVRDSKTAPQGPQLTFTPDAWTRFVAFSSHP